MHRLLLPAAVVAVALGMALGPTRPAMRAADRPADAPPTALGVATCASAACHHGNGELGSRGSEYSTWIAVDPHAKAYRALFNADSRRIQKNLGGGESAHENPLCLQCHGMGATAPAALQPDGVGCEQCHGPAEKWKTTHYLNGFDRTTPGFNDLRKLSPRIQTCLKCHVGDEGREVNHDLIAAGHPRLKFDFGAYYANYPRHWTFPEPMRAQEAAPAQEARLWLMGQAAGSRAALDLLATRATRAAAPWPELSEYECSACHHDLRGAAGRRERIAAAVAKGKRPGDLPMAPWYHGLPAALGGEELKTLLTALDVEMGKRRPDGRKVAADARKAAALLRAWEQEAEKQDYDTAKVRELMATVAGQEALVREGWDGGTQVYLGLAALTAARGEAALRPALADLRLQLRRSYLPKARPLYDLPSGYDAEKLIPLLKRFRKVTD